MGRQTFSKTDDFHLEWEIIEEHCHIHCTVDNWNHTLLRAGYREFVRLRKHVREMGYHQMVSLSPNPKFCELFGATSLGEYKEGYEVMVWATV